MSSEVLWVLPTLLQQTVSNYFPFKAATDKLLMIPLGSLTSGTLRIISLEFESGHFFFSFKENSACFLPPSFGIKLRKLKSLSACGFAESMNFTHYKPT